MVTPISRVAPPAKARTLRKVMVVTAHSGYGLPDGLLAAVHADVVFIESIDRAYAQVKRVAPQIVVLCLSMDDVDGCRLLSLLKLDEEHLTFPW